MEFCETATFFLKTCQTLIEYNSIKNNWKSKGWKVNEILSI